MRVTLLGLLLAIAVAVAAPVAHADAASFGITVTPSSGLGSFVPGITADYTTSAVVTAESSETGATLTIEDPSGLGTPGHLLHQSGTTSLSSPLRASGSSGAPGATGSALTPIGSVPLTLISYGSPLAGPDNATIGLSQHIDDAEALRTGAYGKTFLFTLSSTTP